MPSSTVGAVTVKVNPDLSAFRQATPAELQTLLSVHVYGDDADDGNVCTRAAADLLDRYTIIPK